MPVNLSIKNAPDDVVDALKARAARNHRSLQGELMSLLEEVVRAERSRDLTIRELQSLAKSVDFGNPSESTRMIRDDRDR